MLDFAAWVVVGAFVGWVCGVISGGTPPQIRILNMIIGVVGAFVAALLLTPLFGAGLPQEGAFSTPALLAALVGAAGLLMVLTPTRRGSPVTND
jgi:uncharacterized membrane protein YeaQ/YmgE (transglycosylase-associated protein family)